MKKVFATLAVVALMVLSLSWLFEVIVNSKQTPVVQVECDTVYIHDTLRIVEPVPTSKTVVRVDTAWMERVVNDTVVDTVYVRVPITQAIYEDRRYRAVVQGYQPRLVSLDIYTDKTYVYSHKAIVKPAKLSLSAGIYGGYGPKGFDYGLGIMLGIPIFSWTW